MEFTPCIEQRRPLNSESDIQETHTKRELGGKSRVQQRRRREMEKTATKVVPREAAENQDGQLLAK